MPIQRCPECGGRISTNYCDICMRKVPFAGTNARRERDPWDYASAHREEDGHKCIRFDMPSEERASPKQSFAKVKTTFSKQIPAFSRSKSSKKAEPKRTAILAVLVALLGVFPAIFGLAEEIFEDTSSHSLSAEAFSIETDLPQIRPTGIYDDGEISVTVDALGLCYDEPALSLVIHNRSEGDIDVIVEKAAINGFMMDTSMFAEVDEGDSCQAILSFFQYDLEEAGIETIADIDLQMRIYDRRDYDEICYLDRVRIETDAGEPVPEKPIPTGTELYNDGTVRIYYRNISLFGQTGGEIGLFAENTSDYDVAISANNIFLNGQTANGYLGCSMLPGTRSFDCVYLNDLEDLQIQDVGQIQQIVLDLQIEYLKDWDAVQVYNPSIVIA